MTTLREAAQQALWALQYHVEMTWPIDRTSEAIFNLRAALAQQQAGSWQDGVLEGHLRERERWLAQEQAEPDLSLCPQCNGPADNGHDRSIPPSPYLCTKCMAEMPQPSYNVTVVDDAHPNGIPLEQWQNKPVAWRCACGANLFIDAQGRPASKAEPVEPVAVSVDALAQHIRFVDGNNNLGAGILAEKIVEFLIKLGIGKEQAEPVQEPFGYLWPTGMHPEFRFTQQKRDGVDGMPLYTAPPQRKPLTEEEIDKIFEHLCNTVGASCKTMSRAVERAHGIGEQP